MGKEPRKRGLARAPTQQEKSVPVIDRTLSGTSTPTSLSTSRSATAPAEPPRWSVNSVKRTSTRSSDVTRFARSTWTASIRVFRSLTTSGVSHTIVECGSGAVRGLRSERHWSFSGLQPCLGCHIGVIGAARTDVDHARTNQVRPCGSLGLRLRPPCSSCLRRLALQGHAHAVSAQGYGNRATDDERSSHST